MPLFVRPGWRIEGKSGQRGVHGRYTEKGRTRGPELHRRRRDRQRTATTKLGSGGKFSGFETRGRGLLGLEGVRAEGSPWGLFTMAVEAGTGRSRELNMAINGCLCVYVSRINSAIYGHNVGF